MALFMDFHRDMSGVTLEDLKMAHKADEDFQGKYGVIYRQFWVNQSAGNVFCLIEAPDIESCIKVHSEAHPDYMACAIIEVDQEFVDMTMGKNLRHDGGIVQQEDGSIDLGYRSILMVDAIRKTIGAKDQLNDLQETKSHIRNLMAKHGGRLLEVAADDVVTGVFTVAGQCVRCAIEIQHLVAEKAKDRKADWDIECKIGVAAGQPLTEKDDFFEDALQLSRMLVSIGENNRINISSLAGKLSNAQELLTGDKNSFCIFRQSDEGFLLKLCDIIQTNMAQSDFNVEGLCLDLGISRPQLYRKVISLTGKAPNELIRDIRMQKALTLLTEKDSNIAEVGMRVGINNPSYFAKCFQNKYGVPPSRLNV